MKRIIVVALLIAAASLIFAQPMRGNAGQKGNDEQAVRQLLN